MCLQVLPFFSELGLECPEGRNIADFLQDVTIKQGQEQFRTDRSGKHDYMTVSVCNPSTFCTDLNKSTTTCVQQCHGSNAIWRRKDGGKHDYMTIMACTVFECMYACMLAYMLSDSSHGSCISAHECVMSVAGHGSSLYMYSYVHVYVHGMSDAGHDSFMYVCACELSNACHGSSLYMYTCVHDYQDGMSDAGHDIFMCLGACELSDVGMHM